MSVHPIDLLVSAAHPCFLLERTVAERLHGFVGLGLAAAD